METLAWIVFVIGTIFVFIGIMDDDSDIVTHTGMIFVAVSVCWAINNHHIDNCTCHECTPIVVKEYCPCGCGQYEIVYR